MRQPGRDSLCEAGDEVSGCEVVWVVAQAWAGVQNYKDGKVSYDDIQGLTSASRRVGKCKGTCGGGDGYALVARRVGDAVCF